MNQPLGGEEIDNPCQGRHTVVLVEHSTPAGIGGPTCVVGAPRVARRVVDSLERVEASAAVQGVAVLAVDGLGWEERRGW